MMVAIALLAAFAGFTAICVSMVKHQRDVWARPLARPTVLALRIAACGLLALSWAACSALWGAGMGTVAWVCCAGLAPIALVFPLAYAPRPCAVAGAVAAALAGGLSLVVLVWP